METEKIEASGAPPQKDGQRGPSSQVVQGEEPP